MTRTDDPDTSPEAVERIAGYQHEAGWEKWAALIRRVAKERDEALELASKLLPDRVIECHGDKCRYAWCASCYGDEYAVKALVEIKARFRAAARGSEELKQTSQSPDRHIPPSQDQAGPA